MCYHNISFLFSVTPLWKGEINNSFPFSISSNKIKCSKSLHFVFLLFSTKSLLVVLTESAMCCHNISFLFSVTPFWKCEVNNSFSFYILIKSNFLNRCILFFYSFRRNLSLSRHLPFSGESRRQLPGRKWFHEVNCRP